MDNETVQKSIAAKEKVTKRKTKTAIQKKWIAMVWTTLLCTCMLAACGCNHEWKEADCENPKTCALCGKTEGEAQGHRYLKADCTAPEICAFCDTTRGEPLGHDFGQVTQKDMDTKSSCSRCGVTYGEVAAKEFIVGDWVGFSLETVSNRAPLGEDEFSVTFREDGTFELKSIFLKSGSTDEGTWSYQETDLARYGFLLESSTGSSLNWFSAEEFYGSDMIFMLDPGEETYFVFFERAE